MHSSYSFMTLALDGGEWSVSHSSHALPPGKRPLVPIGQEAGWAPEQVWTQKLEEKSLAPAGDLTSIAQSVARHYTDLANPDVGSFAPATNNDKEKHCALVRNHL
jgi:hypothetical protein